MRDEPKGLSSDLLKAVLHDSWNVDACLLRYAPLGGGSYHWVADEASGKRWFVTVDDLGRAEQHQGEHLTGEAVFADLRAAYESAAALRDCGLSFVVAPVADRSGEVIRRLSVRWAIALFPFVEGRPAGSGEWTDHSLCARAAELVGRVHITEVSTSLQRWNTEIPGRTALFKAFAELDRPWTQGPYGERARLLLASSRRGLEALIDLYDRWAMELSSNTSEPWVLTHGEPHSANFIIAKDGPLYLIDWDTLRLAPRERDLWILSIGDPMVLRAYAQVARSYEPRPTAMEFFRARWALSEICEYVLRFRGHHGDELDDRAGWEELALYLPVDGTWPIREGRSTASG